MKYILGRISKRERSSWNKVIKILLVFTSILICGANLTSCKKYLDEKPNSALNVPETLEDLQGLLDDANLVMNIGLTPSLGEGSSDDYFLLQVTYDMLNSRDKDCYIWKPTEFNFTNDWAKGYAPIFNSNYCLEILDKIPISSSNSQQWNNVKGSALFYRSYNFLNLTWNYAKAYDPISSGTDLGIVLRLGSDFNEQSVRASVKESYDQIIGDTKESAELLPDLPAHTFRPSKAAAYALLSRAYLSMRMYDSAFRYADLCLGLKSNLINYRDNTSDPDIVSNVNSGTAAVFRRFNRETIFYTEINTTVQSIITSRAKIDTVLFPKYASTDLRRTAFFRTNGLYQQFRGSYAQSTTLFFSGIATDEMYLIKAECLARGINGNPGDKDAALTVVNTLLFKRHTNAFLGLTATNANEALDKILLERRKELIMRGLRWMDIKRLNKEGRNIIPTRLVNGQTYTLQPNANYYALPLPTDIISLTGMPQNPQ